MPYHRSHPLRLIVWLLVIMDLLAPLSAQAEESIRLAVLAFRPKPETLAKWQPLAAHLNRAIPEQHFELAAYTYSELESAIAHKQVDLVLTQPAHYVLMAHRNGLSAPLATLIEQSGGHSLAKFGGVIFARAERHDLTSLSDLRGKTIATASTESFGGYQMQAFELQRSGIRPAHDIHLIETGMPHDRAVQAVLDGKADAGFVRSGVLEGMAQEGKLNFARLKVIGAHQPAGFPFVLSTRLYPEWSFTAMPNIDEDIARQVTAALLALPHGGPVARSMGIHGFSIPADYRPVDELLRELRLPPFDSAPNFTAEDVWARWNWQFIASGLAMLTILVLAFNLMLANRRIRQEQRLDKLHLSALGEGVYGIDQLGRCTFINSAALDMLGHDEAGVLGRDQHQLFHHHRPDGAPYPQTDCPVYQTLIDGQVRRLEEWFIRKNGEGFPVSLIVTPIEQDGQRLGAEVAFQDITEYKRLETELTALATTDALTGLANRRHFMARLTDELARIQRHPEQQAALMMLDLDFFKRINDTHGHAAGDSVLRALSDALRQSMRKVDLAGRLGGEEFAVLLPGTLLNDARQFAERLREMVEQMPVSFNDATIRLTVSIGVIPLSTADLDPDQPLQRADLALYRAKQTGRNRVEVETA